MACEFPEFFGAWRQYVTYVTHDHQTCDSSWFIQDKEWPYVVCFRAFIHNAGVLRIIPCGLETARFSYRIF